ncbi:MAG: hypothetical protein C4346_10555 [Chloroflexota bacterium]
MTRFAVTCRDVQPDFYAAVPTLVFRLQLYEATEVQVQAILLRCQIRLEPALRHYTTNEQRLLRDLFGEPERWPETLQPLQFAFVSQVVPSFRGRTMVELPVPCTYDFAVASAKYCNLLETGTIPFLLLFSGTVFLEAPGGFTVEQFPWDVEARYRLPVSTWQAMMDHYFPQSGWIRLSREAIAALQRYKAEHALPTWEHTIESLLAVAGRGDR